MRTGSVFSSLAVQPASVNTVINLKQFRELNSRGSFVRYSHKRLKVEMGGREAFCSGVGGNHSRFAEGFSQNGGDLLSQGTKEGSLRRQACSTGCVRGGSAESLQHRDHGLSNNQVSKGLIWGSCLRCRFLNLIPCLPSQNCSLSRNKDSRFFLK